MFLRISQNLQENTCVGVFLNEVAGLMPVNFAKFLGKPILQNIYKRLLLSKLETARKSPHPLQAWENTERACFRWLLIAYQLDFH